MVSKFSGLRNRTTLEIGHRLVRSRSDDRYIVSYPRSGSTWMRTMLAYLINPDSINHPEVRDAMIPGVTIKKSLYINRLASPRLLMSHTKYLSTIQRAVYIVRDGRDVLISLFHYRITRQGLGEFVDFQSFFNQYFQGFYGDCWHENVVSWLIEGKISLRENLLVVRFEDLKEDTPTLMMNIARFLEIPTNTTKIVEAVNASSLKQMRIIEQKRMGTLSNPNKSFYRGGKTGQWKTYFTPSLEYQFNQVSSEALELADYKYESPEKTRRQKLSKLYPPQNGKNLI